MRPLITHAKARTSTTKSTSTKSSKDIKLASSGSKGGPLSPMSSPRKAPYQSLDEYFPDVENGDGSLEMKKWPQTRQNARFDAYANPSQDSGRDRSFHSILRSEKFGNEGVPVSLLEPSYVGPSRI